MRAEVSDGGAMSMRETDDLHHAVTRRLTQRFFLRWHMTAILACVLLSGVVCSALLLRLGLRSMPWRYVLAVAGSYLVFFVLIRMWLLYVSLAGGGRAFGPGSSLGDPGDLGGGFPRWPGPGGSGFRPGGGSFGGGGASSGFDVPGGSGGSGGLGSGSSDGSGGGGLDLDLDDGWLVLVAFALLLLAVAGTGGYLIYQAPHILAEAAFQGRPRHVAAQGREMRSGLGMDRQRVVGNVASLLRRHGLGRNLWRCGAASLPDDKQGH